MRSIITKLLISIALIDAGNSKYSVGDKYWLHKIQGKKGTHISNPYKEDTDDQWHLLTGTKWGVGISQPSDGVWEQYLGRAFNEMVRNDNKHLTE